MARPISMSSEHREPFHRNPTLKVAGYKVLFLTGTDSRSLCNVMHRTGKGLFDGGVRGLRSNEQYHRWKPELWVLCRGFAPLSTGYAADAVEDIFSDGQNEVSCNCVNGVILIPLWQQWCYRTSSISQSKLSAKW